MAAARAEDRREAARERLEQRVRARVVAARGEVDVLPRSSSASCSEASGPTTSNVLEPSGARPTNVSS